MSKFLSSATVLKGLFAAAAVSAALCAAAPASAADLTLVSDSMDTSHAAHIVGPGGFNEYAYIGPITFQALDAANHAFSFQGYCVDIFHNIGLGALNLAYKDGVLTTDSGSPATVLSGLQLNEISGLVNFSASLVTSGASDLSAKLAGIQGAIWEIANPNFDVVADQSSVQGYISQFEAQAPSLPAGSIRTIFSANGQTQAFAIAGGVPEPTTWAMMIVGLGGIGAMMRRRQALAFA